MFINKSPSGENNICGENVASYRKRLGLSQNGLARQLQLLGLAVTKNTVQQIECGKRFVTDIELTFLSEALGIEFDTLLNPPRDAASRPRTGAFAEPKAPGGMMR